MLELRDVTIRFGGQPPVADSISMSVPEGRRTVIVGESGSGKSVLLLAILGLLPDAAAVTGEILLDGGNLLHRTEKAMDAIRGARISYIPQGGGSGLNPLYTVGRQIGESLLLGGVRQKGERRRQTAALLARFGFDDVERVCRQYPHRLSGGMRQRVLVAMGIARGAALLLADEPTKGLDTGRIDAVADAFGAAGDRTLLCVTHDLRFTRRIADKIVVLYAACIVEACDGDAFFTAPLHPYSRAMLAALPENGLRAVSGFAPPKQQGGDAGGCVFSERCPERGARCGLPPPLVTLAGRKVRCWKYAE